MSPKPQAAEKTAVPAADLSSMLTSFITARRVSTPLVAIETPDPAETMTAICTKGGLNGAPILRWDVMRGLVGLNDKGKKVVAEVNGDNPDSMMNPVNMLDALAKSERETVVFLLNLHRFIADPAVMQGLWNLRDLFKSNRRMAVILSPTFKVPSELQGDIKIIDEPLPTRDQLSKVIDDQYVNVPGVPKPSDEEKSAALDALVGLKTYTAEAVTAASITRKGMDSAILWDEKIKAIESKEGLKVWKSKNPARFEDLRGIDNVVEFFRKLHAADAFGAIVFIDEMDKAFAGGMSDHTGDSGVSKDQVGTLLSYIEDTGSMGVLLAGCAGTGKSQLVKALGYESGKPVIVFDLGAMKGGTVGQSEQQIREALKVVTATAEGRVLFVGTANKTTIFSPELNRRFPDQFFYDLPDDEARAEIWPVYVKKNGLTPQQASFAPGFDRGWTGAEIKRACERAALFGESVMDAARYIIPSAVSGKKAIEALRNEAEGRFLSASRPGFYQKPNVEEVTPVSGGRQIELP